MIDLRSTTFLKTVIIKDGLAQFEHKGESFRLTSPAFKGLNGKTVLINSALEVFRSDSKIGDATPVPQTVTTDEPEIE